MDIDESYLSFYQGPVSDHFDGKRFFNPWNPKGKKGWRDLLKWRMEGNRALWPVFAEMPARPALQEHTDGLRATYIGHATILIQVDGLNMLVDPVFSDRASPFSAVGPKRVSKPFVALENLPKIDYVFVSHNHYDHMDLPSLSWLARNHKPTLITPLGNPRIIKPCIENCALFDLDWHQSAPLGSGANITLTPAQHWSRRGFNDINRDLWGGFVLKTAKGKSIYYSGDSGFHVGMFEDIFKRHGAQDISLIPIGAYEPRWFMTYSHMNPEEAVMTHKILKSKMSMGFHFEAFQLTDEDFDEPRKHLGDALKKHRIAQEHFIAPYPGDSVKA